ncbi:MAG: flippase-like domain-containing protein [Bacteroidaceae bacterium]|nr:flippase-like domain-containing protein [Bacteroidaceae bacterium]
MKKILNYTLKTALPILLGAFILYMVYNDFDFSQLWNELKDMNLAWFALSVFFGIMGHVIRGWRWKLTLAPLGYNPSAATCVDSVYVAYAANLVLPRVGEVSRCVILERYEHVPFAHALGTLVMERMIDTLMVLIITLLAVAVQWPVFCAFVGETGMKMPGAEILSTPKGVFVALLSLVAMSVLLFLLLRRLSVWKRIKSFASRFIEGLLSLRKMDNGRLFLAETVGIWFCYFMQFYLCFYCFGFSSGLSVATALLLFVGGSIAVIVPTPNGAGPWHYVIISIMLLYGVSTTDAQVFALIVHSTQTLLVAILGLYGIAALQLRRLRVKM